MENAFKEIRIKNLTKGFAGNPVIEGLEATFTSEKPTVIFGQSGCGKSTLLRLVAGFEKPDEGEIYFNGEMVSSAKFQIEPLRRNIGFVFQTPALWPNMTVLENVMFGLSGIGKKEKNERAQYYLEKVGAIKLLERYPGKLSGGEARRVSIARALAVENSICLMDEPLVNLDLELKQNILDFIIAEHERSKPCLIYVTHDIEEAKHISERVMMMKGGKFE